MASSEGLSYFKTAPNYRPDAQSRVAKAVDGVVGTVKSSVIAHGKGPLVSVARTAILALMAKLERGQLRIRTSREIYTFGQPAIYSAERGWPNPNASKGDEELRGEIRVVNDNFWLRMLLQSDLGFSEAYMVGDIEVDDLDAVFKLFILNRASLSELSTGWTSTVFGAITTVTNSRFVNSITNAISNISAHYDISNDMFSSFLSADMTYSCAIFSSDPLQGGPEGDVAPGYKPRTDVDELEVAQMNKLRQVIDKAKIGKGDKVLEIGSGWGSFAIEAVRSRGCTVDTLTLSVEQKLLAEARISAAGLSDSIRVHLLDYRSLPPEFDGAFDRLVSIEMIEAVGKEYLETYFEVVERVLKKDRGIAVIQVISMPESRFEAYSKSVDFIQSYIFPGGFLPSVTFLIDSITRGSKNRLIVEEVTNIGPHYARTLREWRRRFEDRFEAEIVPALKEAHPELIGSRKGVDVFKRKWIYYFAYCETGFSMRALGDHIVTMTREGNLSLNQGS